eukprot:Hpha_TRINITY_DN646_c0_g1::TRINITY_DN646_c0_g1_i1::g.21169::m.21169
MGEKRCRYVGQPGSITAIRLDYGRLPSAFEAADPQCNASLAKNEMLRWKAAHRLGEKPEWNGDTTSSWRRFPERAMMRSLAEFQSERLEFNYRAQTLPTCFKDTLFMPKTDKFKFNGSALLSEKDRPAGAAPEAQADIHEHVSTSTNTSLY